MSDDVKVVVERVQPPATLKIELDEVTAIELCALLGGVEGGIGPRRSLYRLYEHLDSALPIRSESFSDLFVGAPRWKKP